MCMTSHDCLVQLMRKDSKKGNVYMHSLSVSMCLSETVCDHTFCMWLHCFGMLSCPDL